MIHDTPKFTRSDFLYPSAEPHSIAAFRWTDLLLSIRHATPADLRKIRDKFQPDHKFHSQRSRVGPRIKKKLDSDWDRLQSISHTFHLVNIYFKTDTPIPNPVDFIENPSLENCTKSWEQSAAKLDELKRFVAETIEPIFGKSPLT